MMNTSARKITAFQLFSISLFSSSLGTLAYTSLQNGGLTPTFLWCVIAFAALQIISLSLLFFAFKRTDSTDGYTLLCRCFSAPCARVLYFFAGCYFLLRAAYSCLAYTDAAHRYMLENISPYYIALLVLASAFCASFPGIRRLAGISVILILVIALPMLLLILAGLASSDIYELRVLLQPSFSEVPSSIAPALLNITGGECALFFLGTARSEDKASKGFLWGTAVSCVLSCLFFAVSVGTVGTAGVELSRFPFIEASRVTSIGGIALTERFDMFLLVIYQFAAILQIGIFLCCCASAFCAVFGLEHRKSFSPLLLPAVLLLYYFLRSNHTNGLPEILCVFGIAVICALVFPLSSIIALLRKKEVSARAPSKE